MNIAQIIREWSVEGRSLREIGRRQSPPISKDWVRTLFFRYASEQDREKLRYVQHSKRKTAIDIYAVVR